jgi:hypothetical protein
MNNKDILLAAISTRYQISTQKHPAIIKTGRIMIKLWLRNSIKFYLFFNLIVSFILYREKL